MKLITEHSNLTLPFDTFWRWLTGHDNCLLQAGSPALELLDQDDFHWKLSDAEGNTHLVQLCRAKDLIAEFRLSSEGIAYVQCEDGDEDGEFLFQCVVETEQARDVAYHFVLSHAYDGADHRHADKLTH